MADSIPLSNAHLLKGLMPTNPHVLVPVESLTNSPTSSTGSASVLEWNSNSDSELFQMSSPASAPTLTAQPTSPTLSPFSTTPSPVGSSRNGGSVVDSQYIIHWPDLECERSPQASPAPVSNFSSPPATVADIDNVPALNEHPEELNVLIERMVLSDLHEAVNKWQSEASNASPAEDATQEDEDSPSPKTPSPVTPEDTSMTSTVLGYVHYDYTKI
ncbi:hypothetical protein BJ912DRAFT_316089 [Pholiota molesta]|nr:hypothetical protein BJ912DRAFT_316089 [Pholiota molesta]